MTKRIYINELTLKVHGNDQHDMRRLGSLVAAEILQRCRGAFTEEKMSDLNVQLNVSSACSTQEMAREIGTAVWHRLPKKQ